MQTNCSRCLICQGNWTLMSVFGTGPSPRLQNVCTIWSFSSNWRNESTQDFFYFPTNFPPQSAPEKLWNLISAFDLRGPTTHTLLTTLNVFPVFPLLVTSCSWVRRSTFRPYYATQHLKQFSIKKIIPAIIWTHIKRFYSFQPLFAGQVLILEGMLIDKVLYTHKVL